MPEPTQQKSLTTATWISIIVATAAIGCSAVFGVLLNQANQDKVAATSSLASLSLTVESNRTDVAVLKDQIATIESDIKDIKAVLSNRWPTDDPPSK